MLVIHKQHKLFVLLEEKVSMQMYNERRHFPKEGLMSLLGENSPC